MNSDIVPAPMRILMNHIYEYKKGVRNMILYTFNKEHKEVAIRLLERQNINYILKPVGNQCLNLFFGTKECLDAIRILVDEPLNKLSPEKDFILGAMLGYDINIQCKRYCSKKNSMIKKQKRA